MADPTTYECTNPACSLGTPGEPGRFTGGVTDVQVQLLTGTPLEHLKKGTDFGDGFCPNCGKRGEKVD